MSIAPLIADKYSKAAFNVAKKAGIVEEFLNDLQLFSDNVSDSLIKEMANPTISKNDLVKIIIQISEKLSISKNVTSFLETIAFARRISFLRQIHQKFIKLSKLDKNILEVDVFVANDLDKKQTEEIKALLKKKYFDNIIEINQIIKKDILGGVMIKIGSTMIDSSLRNKLSGIENELKTIIN